MTAWPGILATVAQVAGDQAAQRLALQYGGHELKLSARPDSKLAEVVGEDAARLIVAELGSGKVVVPMAHLRGQRARRQAVAMKLADGVSVADTARACDVHERTVWRVKSPKKPQRGDKASGDLFDRKA